MSRYRHDSIMKTRNNIFLCHIVLIYAFFAGVSYGRLGSGFGKLSIFYSQILLQTFFSCKKTLFAKKGLRQKFIDLFCVLTEIVLACQYDGKLCIALIKQYTKVLLLSLQIAAPKIYFSREEMPHRITVCARKQMVTHCLH